MNPFGKKDRFSGLIPVLSLCVLGVAISVGIAGADIVWFDNSGADQNWTNAGNWISTNARKNAMVPGGADEARIRNAAVEITTAVTVGYLKNGVDSPAKVIIDGGSLLAVGTNDYNSACYNRQGDLTIENGGSATFGSYFMVGFKDTPRGAVTINSGTLRVAGIYFHNKEYEESNPLKTRTTIHPGGLLEADLLELNAGVMDVAGGTVMIKQASVLAVEEWVQDGRMIAMGGEAGWKIKATTDPATGYTVIVAEESSAGLEGARWIAGLSTANQIFIGLTGAVLLLLLIFLLAFYLYRRKKKLDKRKLDSEEGSTYEY